MKVLFICRGNVGRSQMAEAFYNKLSKKNRAISSGCKNYYYRRFWHSKMKATDPVVTAMKEIGFDISKNKIKKNSREMVNESGIVIAIMAKKRAREDLPKYVVNDKKFRLWDIKDVSGSTAKESALEKHRRNRDKIRILVKKLVKETG